MSFIAGLHRNFSDNAYNDIVRQEQAEQDNPSLAQGNEPGVMAGLFDPEVPVNAVTRGLVAEPAVVGSLAAATLPMAIDKYAGTNLTDVWMKHTVEPAMDFRESLKIDPKTHGIASQVVDGLFSMLPQAAATGAVGTGLLTGITDTAENVRDGKTLDVAYKMGLTTGLSNALGVYAPAAFASTKIPMNMLAQRIVSGSVSNVLLGIPERVAKHQILEDAGFKEQAEQYRWDDKQAIAVDAILGVAFGGLDHVTFDPTHPQHNHIQELFGGLGQFVKPSVIDAALTLNEARRIDDSAPGIPTSPEAANAHTRAFYDAQDALLNGYEVTSFVPMTKVPEISPDILAMAGNRMSRGDRQSLEKQQADIEYKLTQFDTQALVEGYTKQDFIDQAKSENPRAPARKIAIIAEKMAAESKASDRADMQSILLSINEKLNKDDEYRAAHAEASRAEQAHLIENGFIQNPKVIHKQKQLQDEINKLSQAYDRVSNEDIGSANNPLVLIKPEDIEAVVIARGGWKGHGSLEVKGSGWGLAKFIWKHGEKSAEFDHLKVRKEDILAFPNVIRDYLPSREASSDKGREWRVELPGKDGINRIVVFADNLINGQQDRHLVTVHVQQEGRTGDKTPLSEKRIAESPKSYSRRLESPQIDTAHGVLARESRNDSTQSSISESWELTAARQFIDRHGDIEIPHIDEEGNEHMLSLQHLLDETEKEMADGEKMQAATNAAITCFLRFGDNL